MSFIPEIVVLYCQHSVAGEREAIAAAHQTSGLSMRPMMMPCSSKVEVPHLLKILEQGADGVELVVCPEGACRFLVGNLKAQKRVRYAGALLDQVELGGQRLGLSHGISLSAEELVAFVRARAEAVMPLGPNPMKRENPT
jgi:coenzyme F420-reducing hydrogenase delta subunit